MPKRESVVAVGAIFGSDGESQLSAYDYIEINNAVASEALRTSIAPKRDMVNHPPHYTSHPSGVECIQITRYFNFNLGNVIKYLWRAPLKGATVEDLKKARWYLDDEIKQREGAA